MVADTDTDTEKKVAQHYGSGGGEGTLEDRVLEALAKSGKDVANLKAEDLSGADEFHLGWRAQTVEIGKALDLKPGMKLLDIGSGIGGPARYFAEAHRCQVTGIDLTPEFVACATALTKRCGLANQVRFQQGSALDLPSPDGAFDAATLIHVGMNIEDKATLFREARRVLKSGTRFCVYDIMRMDDSEIPYPMPWAVTVETSFVEIPDTYRKLLGQAGFKLIQERNRRDFCLELARKMREYVGAHGVPPLGLHILMGPASKERLANVMAALERGAIAPIEMVVEAI